MAPDWVATGAARTADDGVGFGGGIAESGAVPGVLGYAAE